MTVTISLDSLDEAVFRHMSGGRGDLARVLEVHLHPEHLVDEMDLDPIVDDSLDADQLQDLFRTELRLPGARRIWYVADAFRAGYSLEELFELSAIDPWFLRQVGQIVEMEAEIKQAGNNGGIGPDMLRQAKEYGFSDQRLAALLGSGLTGVLYVLDEPTIGLHARDVGRLVAVLKQLRDFRFLLFACLVVQDEC